MHVTRVMLALAASAALLGCGIATSTDDEGPPAFRGQPIDATPPNAEASAKNTGLVAGAWMYRDAATLVPRLKDSGYTSITLSTLHVDDNGDLKLNDNWLFADGFYVGGPEWPSLVSSLKQPPTQVRRLEILVGSASNDFAAIKTQLATTDVTTSALYRNFKALKALLPNVDAISLDDESTYDVDSTVAFGSMLGSLGFKLSIAAHERADHWGEVVKRLTSEQPGIVDHMLLQLYAGGTERDVEDWRVWFSGIPIEAGYWSRHGADCRLGVAPEVVTPKLYFLRDKIAGASMWLLDDMLACPAYSAEAYAHAIDEAWTFRP